MKNEREISQVILEYHAIDSPFFTLYRLFRGDLAGSDYICHRFNSHDMDLFRPLTREGTNSIVHLKISGDNQSKTEAISRRVSQSSCID